MDTNEQQLETLINLIKEQNQLISRMGIITIRIASMLLFVIVLQILVGIVTVLF